MDLVSHYTSANTAINFILPNSSLRFNELENSNDPWEYKKNISVQLSENILEVRDCFEKRDELITYINKIKSISFTSDLPKESKRCFCNPLMWSHYGDNHKGICLVFDLNKLKELANKQFKNKILVHDFVKYKNEFDKILISPINKINDCEIEKTLLNKKEIWGYENEYRFVIKPSIKKSSIKNISSALKAIILGGNILEIKQEIIQWIITKLYPNTKLFKSIWSNDEFRILDLSDDTYFPPCSDVLN